MKKSALNKLSDFVLAGYTGAGVNAGGRNTYADVRAANIKSEMAAGRRGRAKLPKDD